MLMLIRNPWIILGAMCAVLTAYFYGHHAGFAERDQEMQVEIAHQNDESRKVEQSLRDELHETSIQLGNANDSITQKQSALDRAISTGRMRLPSSGCVQATPSAAAPSGNQQDGAESDREVLRLIAAITADGDRAIVQLNACVDAYNQVRSQINGDR